MTAPLTSASMSATNALRARAAIFDLDGVLVDTARLHFEAWARLAAERGAELEPSVGDAVKGIGRRAALDIVARAAGLSLSETEAAVAAERKNSYYLESLTHADPSMLLPGALDALTSLRAAGIPIALASASKNARTVLRAAGIEDRFDAIVDGTVVAAAKPDPAVFLEASRRLGVDPVDAVVFEDAQAGVDGARNAGCAVVGIGDLPPSGADMTAPDLASLSWPEIFPSLASADIRPHVPDLTGAPFHLDEAAVSWVTDRLAAMTSAQKVGQMLCVYLDADDVPAWTRWLDEHRIAPGAGMLLHSTRDVARATTRALQSWSEVPMLIAGNLESGDVKFLTDGEAFAYPMQVAATGDVLHAERLGVHCARAGNDVGVNWAFAPVIDVAINPQNPITNTRAFGQDPALVAEMGAAFVRALETRGIATSAKHFPGDGTDDRDQHLVTTNNDLDAEDWETTFAPVYRAAIDAGARTIMVGHIRQPALSRRLRPGIQPAELMPATLAPELVQDVLRGQLGFNGLVVTDNTAMAGFTTVMPREEALPRTVLAGCDMVLGNLDLQEDFQILLTAVEAGTIPMTRIDEAVLRILATKASIGLHQDTDRSEREQPDPTEEGRWRRELAERSVTLVKDTQRLLPLSPQHHRRALVYVLGDEKTFYDPTGPFAGRFVAGLRERGLKVDVRHIPGPAEVRRTPLDAHRLHHDFDVCVYFANLAFTGHSNSLRVSWTPWQGPDAPRHVATLPTAVVSIADPYLLQDVPMIKTAINGYTPNDDVVDVCVATLFGEHTPTGMSPVDPFAGHWDSAL